MLAQQRNTYDGEGCTYRNIKQDGISDQKRWFAFMQVSINMDLPSFALPFVFFVF